MEVSDSFKLRATTFCFLDVKVLRGLLRSIVGGATFILDSFWCTIHTKQEHVWPFQKIVTKWKEISGFLLQFDEILNSCKIFFGRSKSRSWLNMTILHWCCQVPCWISLFDRFCFFSLLSCAGVICCLCGVSCCESGHDDHLVNVVEDDNCCGCNFSALKKVLGRYPIHNKYPFCKVGW